MARSSRYGCGARSTMSNLGVPIGSTWGRNTDEVVRVVIGYDEPYIRYRYQWSVESYEIDIALFLEYFHRVYTFEEELEQL